MFQTLKSLFRSHWKKLLYAAIAARVASFGMKFLSKQLILQQENQQKIFWRKIKQQQHFDKIEKNINKVFLDLLVEMKITISETLNVEALHEKLKNNECPNKLQGWNQMKVTAISRILTYVYGSSLLYLLLRVQLSLMGGRLYVQENSCLDEKRISDDTQLKFVNLSKEFVTTGVVKLCSYMMEKTKRGSRVYDLKRKMSAQDLETMFLDIVQTQVLTEDEQDTEFNMWGNPCEQPWKYLLPDPLLKNMQFFRDSQIEIVGDTDYYKLMVAETYDVLSSSDCISCLVFFQSSGISHFVDRLSEIIRDKSQEGKSVNPDDSSTFDTSCGFEHHEVALAKLVPYMAALHTPDVLEDPWVNVLISNEPVRTFSGNIYEAFSSDVQ